MLIGLETVLFGLIAGLALGLTGGGGATLAVPLLVYGIGVAVPQAVAISLLAVGGSAVAGLWNRLRHHEVDVGAGTMLAGWGAAAAPAGAWIGAQLSEAVVLGAFGILVGVVSLRMWRTAHRPTDVTVGPCALRSRWSWRCFSVLSVTGAITGILSGIFGVGGGFLLVPAIVFATGTDMHRAVATSLMVVAVVSASAFASMMVDGRVIPWPVATTFLGGGLVGMAIGTILGRWLTGPRLKQTFAVILGAMGIFVIIESMLF